MKAQTFLALFFVSLLGFGIWIGVRNYFECRDHGFTVLYCLTRK